MAYISKCCGYYASGVSNGTGRCAKCGDMGEVEEEVYEDNGVC